MTAARHTSDALSEKMQQLEEIRSSQAFLLALTDAIRPLGHPDAVTDTACELLGRKLGASRVLYADIDDAPGTVFVRRDWTADGLASLAGQTRNIHDFGPSLLGLLRSGDMLVNHDVTRDARSAGHAQAYAEGGVAALLLLPLVKEGTLRAVLTVQSAAPRVWRAEELQLAQQTAERTWSAVAAAQAQAQLRTERDQNQYIFDSMGEVLPCSTATGPSSA